MIFFFHSLTISHGQADFERGFSLNKNLLNQNMEALTITSRRKVKDHLISNKIVLHEFKYPPHCCNMHSQLNRSMKFIQKQAGQKKNGTEKVKKKEVIDQEIKDTEALRQQADKTVNNCWSMSLVAICKMFGLCHSESLKNDQSVSQHNFFQFFYIFNFCTPDPGENKTKRKELSRRLRCDVFCDLGL